MPNVAARSYRHTLGLILILVIGFGLRAAGVICGQAYNYGTQSAGIEAYEVAVAFEQGDARAQYIGQPNFKGGSKLPGPAWALFCVAGLKAWGSIEGVSWLIVLTNVAAIYLVYLLAARTIGPPAGLGAALLVAVSPLAIHYSIQVYNPAVIPCLSTLTGLALWQVVRVDRSRAIGGVVFLVFLMPQFHTSGLSLIPAIVVMIWLAGRPLNVAWLAIGVVAGLALYVPYIAGEMANAWGNSHAMGSPGGVSRPREPYRAITAPIGFLVNYWTPRLFYTPAEFREMCRYSLGGVGWVVASNVLATIIALLLGGRIFLLGHAAMRESWLSPRAAFARSPGFIFLAVLYVVPLVTEVVTGPTFYPRYALVLLAPLFSLAGAAAVAWLTDPRYRRAFAVAAAVMIMINVWFMLATYRFQGQHIRQAPRFLASFRQLEEVHRSLRAFAGAGRAIEIDDSRYVAPPAMEKSPSQPDAMLIRRYVIVRERERTGGAVGSTETKPVVFHLLAGSEARTDPASGTVFSGNGIHLVATQEGKTADP